MQISNGLLVEIDGTPLPEDIAPLLTSAHVDDSLHLPDLFVLRFRDPDRAILGKTGLAVGTTVRILVSTADSKPPRPLITGEVTALEAEFDSAGTFVVVRGYDHAHRLFRGRRTATYTQVTASDIVRAVAQRAVAQDRHHRVDDDGVRPRHPGRRHRLAVPVRPRPGDRLRDRRARRRPRLPPAAPGGRGAGPGGQPGTDPLVLHLGTDLLRLRTGVTAAQQVKEVQVRGWDIARKQALVATVPAAPAAPSCRR